MDSCVEACADPHDKARKRIERQLSETSDSEERERLNNKLQSFDKDAIPLSKANIHSICLSVVRCSTLLWLPDLIQLLLHQLWQGL
jgi:hypothetical protein